MTAEYPATVAIVTSQALVPSFFFLSYFLGLLVIVLAGGRGGEFGKWERGGKGEGRPKRGSPLYAL